MARVRHLALLTNDQERLAEFYKSVFAMHEVHRHVSGQGGGDAIYLSDGYLNLAILPARGRPEGIFHFGIEVDDVEKARDAAVAAGATPQNEMLPRDGRFTETFVFDPAGTRVDIASGWKH